MYLVPEDVNRTQESLFERWYCTECDALGRGPASYLRASDHSIRSGHPTRYNRIDNTLFLPRQEEQGWATVSVIPPKRRRTRAEARSEAKRYPVLVQISPEEALERMQELAPSTGCSTNDVARLLKIGYNQAARFRNVWEKTGKVRIVVSGRERRMYFGEPKDPGPVGEHGNVNTPLRPLDLT